MAQNGKTPVTVLQELAVKLRIAFPDYQVVPEATETRQIQFSIQVSVAGIQESGSASSKRMAKQQAAHNALLKLKEMGLYVPVDNFEFKVPLKDKSNPYSTLYSFVVDLQNLCLKHKIPGPVFYEVSSSGPPHAKEFTYECKISSVKVEGKGNSKKIAKQIAAKVMLQRINEELPDLIAESEKFKKLKEKDAGDTDKRVNCDKPLDVLVKLMKLQNLTHETFANDLKEGTEHSLKIILGKLKLSYTISQIQDNPFTAALTLHTDPPFVVLGMGSTYEEAVQKALKQTIMIMDSFLKKVVNI